MPETISMFEQLAVRPDKAAAMIDVSPSKFQRLINQGLVECAREGNTTLVLVASLRRFLADNKLQPRPAPAPRPPQPGEQRRPRGRPRKTPAPQTEETAAA